MCHYNNNKLSFKSVSASKDVIGDTLRQDNQKINVAIRREREEVTTSRVRIRLVTSKRDSSMVEKDEFLKM